MNKILSLIILFFGLVSCQSDLIEGIHYNFTQPKIAMDGALIGDRICTLAITRTILNSDKVFDLKNAAIKDAQVVLINENINDTLNFDAEKFLYKSNHLIIPNSFYKLEVRHKEYGLAYVDSIYVPNKINVSSISIDSISPNLTGLCGTNLYRNLEIKINVDFDNNFKDEVFFDIFYPNGSSGICSQESPIFENYNCVQETKKLLSVSCMNINQLVRIEAIGVSSNRLTKIYLPFHIRIGNKNYRNFRESTNERLGVELGLLDPVTLYSNVKNGYGLVSGYYLVEGSVSL